MTLGVRLVTGSAIGDWVDALADLRIRVFRDFPYLYEGSVDYEKRYLATYSNCPDALAVLVLDAEAVVGASTGLPMAAETPEFRRPVSDGGYDPATFFYCGESVLLPSYRGRGVYRTFFRERENHARALGNMTHIGFCGVLRDAGHPAMPTNYQPLDPIWKSYGYEPQPHMVARYSWRDIGQQHESAHELMFWTKLL